jgi:hypothetical protein
MYYRGIWTAAHDEIQKQQNTYISWTHGSNSLSIRSGRVFVGLLYTRALLLVRHTPPSTAIVQLLVCRMRGRARLPAATASGVLDVHKHDPKPSAAGLHAAAAIDVGGHGDVDEHVVLAGVGVDGLVGAHDEE